MYIPDISYHLIFSFLSFKQLSIVIQCSKEWQRISTHPSFINMFSNQSQCCLFKNKRNINSSLSSPFKNAIRNIKIDINNPEMTTISLVVHFSRFTSLEFVIDFGIIENLNFDWVSLFQELGPRLLELKVEIRTLWIVSSQPSILSFQKSLSFLSNLTSLSLLTSRKDEILIIDVSFLSHMKKLKSFICNCIDNILISNQNLVHNLSCCSDITDLKLNMFFNYVELLTSFKNSKLTNIGIFRNIDQSRENGLVQIFNQFNHLKCIDIVIHGRIPCLLGKWIRHLVVVSLSFDHYSNIMDDILSLSNLHQGIHIIFVGNMKSTTKII
jgi:hypothetical protein